MGPGVSGECSLRCGMHFNEDHFLPEIMVNSETGEVLPEGSKGELVITTTSLRRLSLFCVLSQQEGYYFYHLRKSANAEELTPV